MAVKSDYDVLLNILADRQLGGLYCGDTEDDSPHDDESGYTSVCVGDYQLGYNEALKEIYQAVCELQEEAEDG